MTKLFGLTGFVLVSTLLWLLTLYYIHVLNRELGKISIFYEVVYPVVISCATC